MIRILLVDDLPTVRQGWGMRLALEEDMVVVGEADDGQEAIELVEALGPDVVVMDVEMPLTDGITTTAELQRGRAVAVVLMSIHDDTDTRRRALEAGASAFVSKQEPFNVVLRAIRQVAGSRPSQ